MAITIVKADIEKFRQYQKKILDIYTDTGTSGVMEQYLDRDTELRYMLSLFDAEGYGYLVFDKKNLVGFMLACALEHDDLLPRSIKHRFPVDKCLYISEMHVRKEYQGKGIGSQLMQRFMEEADKSKWKYLFIRSWKENRGAIQFYQRFGFKLDEIIDQQKIRKNQSGTFMIQKQYLWQKL